MKFLRLSHTNSYISIAIPISKTNKHAESGGFHNEDICIMLEIIEYISFPEWKDKSWKRNNWNHQNICQPIHSMNPNILKQDRAIIAQQY